VPLLILLKHEVSAAIFAWLQPHELLDLRLVCKELAKAVKQCDIYWDRFMCHLLYRDHLLTYAVPGTHGPVYQVRLDSVKTQWYYMVSLGIEYKQGFLFSFSIFSDCSI
jgi:hypothetical protein